MENNSNTLKKKFDEPAECPHCGAENKPTLTLHIDAKDTRIVKKLLDRKLFEFKCNKCKQKYIYEYFFEYIDEENSIDILCTMNPEYLYEFETTLLSNRSTVYDQKFRFTRLVATFTEFKEKHNILTNGLDDRIIEFIKLDIRENRAAECGKIKSIICGSINDKRIAIRAAGEKKSKVFYIPFEEYEEFKSKYAHWLPNYKPVVIDVSWAIDHAD